MKQPCIMIFKFLLKKLSLCFFDSANYEIVKGVHVNFVEREFDASNWQHKLLNQSNMHQPDYLMLGLFIQM
jgi:hypothetical protein